MHASRCSRLQGQPCTVWQEAHGLQALPACTLLHFAAADLKEAEGNIAEAGAVYSSLTAQLLPEGDDSAETAAPQVGNTLSMLSIEHFSGTI